MNENTVYTDELFLFALNQNCEQKSKKHEQIPKYTFVQKKMKKKNKQQTGFLERAYTQRL